MAAGGARRGLLDGLRPDVGSALVGGDGLVPGVGAAGRHLLGRPARPGASCGSPRSPSRCGRAAVLLEGRRWTSGIAPPAVIAAAVLLGSLRTRAAYLAELEERDRLLERGRDQQAELAVAAERARIARDMHDIVAHNLTVMVALADGAGRTATAAPERAVHHATGAGDRAGGAGGDAAGSGRPARRERVRGLGRRLRTRVEHAAADLNPQPGLGDLDQPMDQVRAAGLRSR